MHTPFYQGDLEFKGSEFHRIEVTLPREHIVHTAEENGIGFTYYKYDLNDIKQPIISDHFSTTSLQDVTDDTPLKYFDCDTWCLIN